MLTQNPFARRACRLLLTIGSVYLALVTPTEAQQTCPCSIWSASSTPAQAAADGSAVELGVKFRADANGTISGIRFYKYALNTGTHTGTLWTSAGVMLATVTFAGETASGWQQATFSSPIAITANTTYVASYHTNTGSYGFTGAGLTAAVDSGQLHALGSAASGGNGVYLYSAPSGFPNQTYNAANYWVDVVYTPADTTPPTVTAVTPANGASNIALTSNLTITFSEAMTAGSITAANLTLADAAAAPVPVAVTFNAATGVATMTPGASFTNSTIYTGKIKSGAGGVTDAAGNPLASDFVWTFTTVPDTTPPTVTAVTPANGASNIALASSVTATFNEAMTAGSISASSITLVDATATAVPSGVTFNAATRTVTLTPNAPLANGTTYTARIVGGVGGAADAAGNTLASDVVWTFTTVPDTTPPTVTGVTPTNGSSGVGITTTLTVTFNEPMAVASLTAANFTVSGGTVVAVTYDSATRTATIAPTSVLANGAAYTATVKGGASGVKDLAGNALTSDYVWTFTTASGTCPCSIWSASATPAQAAADTSSVELGVKFRADVSGWITGIRYYKYAANTGLHVGSLWTAGGALLANVTFSGETASGWQQATFATPVAVTANTTYVASYHTNTGSYGFTGAGLATAVDASPLHALSSAAGGGNGVYMYGAVSVFPNQSYNASNYWVDAVFVTAVTPPADVTPPTVTGVTPGGGSTGVALTVSPTVTFSEAMTAASISGTSVTLTAAGGAVAAAVTYNAGTMTATLTPAVSLINGTTYTVTVKSGASGVTDAAGNALASDYAWAFTTVAGDITPPTVTSVSPATGATAVAVATSVTVTFSEAMAAASITAANLTLVNSSAAAVAATVSYNAATNTATLTPAAALGYSATYTATVRSGGTGVKDLAGNALVNDYTWSFTTDIKPCPCSIWLQTSTPAQIANDTGQLELGVKFRSDISGLLSGIRFYKYAANTGTHIGSLWTAGGALLATVTFTSESASGWQEASFAAPVAIAANTTYVASYHTNSGGYGFTGAGLAAAVDNAPLHALSSGASGGNGLYLYGAGGFPTQSFNAGNYWVDVVFAPGVADTTPPVVTAISPANGTSGVPLTASVTATFNEAMQASSINAASITLVDGTSALVSSTVTYDAATRTATLTPTVSLAGLGTYTAKVKGGASGVKDATGNALASDATWTFSTTAPAGGCPCSIWAPNTTPGPVALDPSPVELGVKFQADVNGTITGLRYYKYAQNTGPHIGNLWTAGGTLLATVTFPNEGSAGWQYATFATPVAITANTTYVASYYTTTGFYAGTGAGFVTAIDNAPLHAPSSAAAGGNGLYRYAFTSTFPTFTYNAANYWMDVIFMPAGLSDGKPPTVMGVTPANGATNVAFNMIPTVTFSEGMSAASVNSGTFTLRDGANAIVPAAVTYNPTTLTATLTPTASLESTTTYTVTVKGGASGVKDAAGNALAADVIWTFTSGLNPSKVGQWSDVFSWPMIPINVTLLRTGEVLAWDGGTAVGDAPTHGGLTSYLWNPATNVFTPVPLSRTDLFCATACAMPDGRLFVAGGSDPTNNGIGTTDVNIFNPVTRTWSSAPSMANRRWYPTATCLADGRILLTSGTQFGGTDWVLTPELYSPATNSWTSLTAAQAIIPNYPHAFLLPDGRVLYSSTFQQPIMTDALNVSTQARTLIDSQLLDGGSAVMYQPGKIMKAGGAAANERINDPSTGTTYVLDMTQAVPAWRQTMPMQFLRSYHTLTSLPDGSVLVTGGGTTKASNDVAHAVFEAELWSPQTETWATLAQMQRPRLYHSSALLLPDGRVLVGGGGHNFRDSLKETDAEIYSPPYLFKGPRPTISSAPGNIVYGNNNVFVGTPDAGNIASVALIRLGSMTHGINNEQRYVPLTFQQTSGGLNVQMPSNANLAPPGYYMLFIVNAAGVPSTAPIVNVGY